MRWSANRSSPTGPAVCTTMDPRASMVHNHGSHGDLVGVPSSADRASSSNPHGRGPSWSSLDGRQIDHRRPGQHGAQPWIPRDLVGVRSSDQRRPGQQQQSPREGTWLEFPRWIPRDLVGVRSSDHRRAGPAAIPTGGDLVGVRSSDHRRPGQHGAQPWIHGPA
jgi:hypothetical protein